MEAPFISCRFLPTQSIIISCNGQRNKTQPNQSQAGFCGKGVGRVPDGARAVVMVVTHARRTEPRKAISITPFAFRKAFTRQRPRKLTQSTPIWTHVLQHAPVLYPQWAARS